MEHLLEEVGLFAATGVDEPETLVFKTFVARRSKFDFLVIRVSELIELFGADGEFALEGSSLKRLLEQTDACHTYSRTPVPQKRRKATE